GHEADDWFVARTEFGRAGMRHAGQVACRLDHRHLHTEADAEEGHAALAGEAHGMHLTLGAALAESARHEDAVDAFEVMHRILALEDLRIEPAQIDMDIVG